MYGTLREAVADSKNNRWVDRRTRDVSVAGMGGMMLFAIAVLIWALFAPGSGAAGSGGGFGGGTGNGVGAGTGDGLADAGAGPGAARTGTGRGANDTGGNDVPQGSPDGEVVSDAPHTTRANDAPPEQITGRTAPRIGFSAPKVDTTVATTQPDPVATAPRGDSAPGRTSAGAAGAGGGGGGGTAVEFMGVETEARHVVYVLDRSGSMSAGGRWYHAYLELRKSVQALDKNCTFSIVYFDHDFYPMPEPGQMHKATDKAKSAALDWANTMTPAGATDPSAALRYVFENLKCDTIFLMTDGEFGEQETRNVLNQFNNGAKVAVHAIAFHSNAGEPVLQGIARDFRGQYRFVPPP